MGLLLTKSEDMGQTRFDGEDQPFVSIMVSLQCLITSRWRCEAGFGYRAEHINLHVNSTKYLFKATGLREVTKEQCFGAFQDLEIVEMRLQQSSYTQLKSVVIIMSTGFKSKKPNTVEKKCHELNYEVK